MSKYNRVSYLATCGNTAIAAADLTLYSKDTDFLPIYTGQLVIYDPKTNTTLDVADIATATNLAVGVGIGVPGQNATEIQHISKEEIDLCQTNIRASVSSPVCGVGQVVDVFFNGCIECNKTYSIAVNLDDSHVRSVYELNDPAPYIFTVTADCCDTCDTCDNAYDAESLVCKFVDLINGTVQKDPTKITRFANSNMTNQYQPFRAAKLYLSDVGAEVPSDETTWTFCIAPDNSACENCIRTEGITGISINGEVTTFVNTTVAGDTTYTHTSQIKNIVEQANKALALIGGSAHLDHGIGACCSYCIKINTCANDVFFTTEDAEAPITGTRSNPFSTFDVEPICKGCGVDATTIAPTVGFRIYVDPIEVPCDCAWPPNLPVPNTYVRRVDVQAWGEGWPCSSLLVKETTAQTLPEGFGYYWQDMARTGRSRGGHGKDFRYNDVHRGRIGLPDKSSVSASLPACLICDEQYCVYNLETTTTKSRRFNNAPIQSNTDLDYLLVPKSDTTAQTAVQAVLNALNARGTCVGGTVTCA